MKSIDVYEQYFGADCVYDGVQRRGALVKLTAVSEEGNITYSVQVSFFPHEDAEDFRLSYDAEKTEVLFTGKGRRSAKRDAAYMGIVRETADRIAADMNGTIDWDAPLIEARRG